MGVGVLVVITPCSYATVCSCKLILNTLLAIVNISLAIIVVNNREPVLIVMILIVAVTV